MKVSDFETTKEAIVQKVVARAILPCNHLEECGQSKVRIYHKDACPGCEIAQKFAP
jgi:hypothetical protein